MKKGHFALAPTLIVLFLTATVQSYDFSTDDKLQIVNEVRKEYMFWHQKLPNSNFDRKTKNILQKNIDLALSYIGFMERLARGEVKLSTAEGGWLIPTTRAYKDWAQIMKGLGAKCRADPSRPGKVSFPFPPIETMEGEKVARIYEGAYKDYYMDNEKNIIIPGIRLILQISLERSGN